MIHKSSLASLEDVV